MKKRFSSVFLITAGFSILGNVSAHAQSVDYASLQSLFGEPITTSATGTPQRASEVATNMTIITADQIRQSGGRTVPEVLSRVPGLDILQTGENTFDVGVRGYQQVFQPRLLVLVDGRQVFIDDYSRTVWSNIPVNVEDIRQIEVVKGASSALFGSNAAGGVVNIVTYSPKYDSNNVVSAGGGSQSRVNLAGTGTVHFGESGLKLSAGGMTAEEFHTDNNSNDYRTIAPQDRHIAASSIFQVTPDLQANTEFTVSSSKANPVNPSYYTDSESMTTYSAKGGVTWQSPIGLISSQNYFNNTFARVVGQTFNSHNSTQLIVSQLEDQFKIGSANSFRAALEFRNKAHHNEGQEDIPQHPAFEQQDYSASGTWLAQLSPSLSWTNAVRIDHQEMQQTGTLFADAFVTNSEYSHVINALSVNSGLVYKATDLDTLRATYGRGVQMPSFFQEGLTAIIPIGVNTFADIEGNPNLKPTIVQNYELGYDRALPDLYSLARFSVYYEMNQDVVGFDAGSFIRVVGPNTYSVIQSVNVGNSHGFGGEIELSGSHNGFRWDGSYSYARAIDNQGVATNLGYDGSSPRHHFRLFGGYTTGAWEFDGNGQYVTSNNMMRASSTSAFAPIAVDGYFSLGGRIGYALDDHFTLALSGSNITNRVTNTSPYPAVERQALLSLTGKF
jgi:iron complex outermembrane receptor protein